MIGALRVAAICLGVSGAALAGAAKVQPLHLTSEWQVSLDASGKVSALQDRGNLKPVVHAPLERAIRGWTFEPGRLNGQAAPTETTLTLGISFIPAADGNYALRIDDARTGGSVDPRSASSRTMPRIPRDALRVGLAAMVVVKASYDENGRVVSVEPQPDQGIDAPRSLEAATVAAVKRWVAQPERVGGHGVASSMMVPICYTVSAGPRPPDFDCSWTPPGSRSKIDNGGAFALEPSAHLRSDVIGHTL